MGLEKREEIVKYAGLVIGPWARAKVGVSRAVRVTPG